MLENAPTSVLFELTAIIGTLPLMVIAGCDLTGVKLAPNPIPAL